MLALLLIAAVFAAQEVVPLVPCVDVENGVCACREDLGNTLNFARTLPRMRAGGAVTGDLSQYDIFTFDNGTIKMANMSNIDPAELAKMEYDATSVYALVETYLFYIVFPILLVLLWWIFTCCFCLCRYFCCCCGKGGGTCGKKQPTKKTCCLGYYKKEHKDGNSSYTYGACGKLCSRIYMIIFILVILMICSFGHYAGIMSLVTSPKAIAQKTQVFANIAKLTVPPMEHVLHGLIGGSLVTFIHSLNTTLDSGIHWKFVNTTAHCIGDAFDEMPEIQYFIDFIDQLNGAIALLPSNTDALANITMYETITNALTYDIPFCDDVLTKAIAMKTNINTNAAPNMDIALSLLDGIVSTGDSAITMWSKVNGMPTTATLSALKTDLGNLATTGALTTNEGLTLRNRIRDTVVGLKTALQQLPSLNSIESTVDAMNLAQTNAQASGVWDLLIAQLTSLKASIESLPSSTAINANVSDIQTQTNNFDGESARIMLGQVKQALVALPRVDELAIKLDELESLRTALTCAADLKDVLISVNTTLASFDMVANITEMVDKVVESFDDMLNEAGQIKQDLLDTQAKLDAFDIDTVISDLNGFIGDLETLTTGMDFAAFTTKITSMDAYRSMDLAGFITQLQSVKTWLADPSITITADAKAKLTAFESVRTTLPTELDNFLISMKLWASGKCVDDSAVYCMADCGWGCPNGASTATYNTESYTVCTGTGVCDMTVAFTGTVGTTDLETKVQTAVDARTGIDGLATGMTAMEGVITDLDTVNPATLKTSMTGLVAAMPAGLESFKADADGVKALMPAPADIVTIRTQWDSLYNLVHSFDFNSLKKTLTDAKDMLDPAMEEKDKYLQIVRNVVTFFFETLNVYLDRINRDSMMELLDSPTGLHDAVEELLAVVNGMHEWAVDQMILLDNTTAPFQPLNISDIDDIYRMFDVLQSDVDVSHGPIYFLVSLANTMPGAAGTIKMKPIPADDDLVQWNADFVAFPDEEMCLTSACINNTVDFFAYKKLSEIDEKIPLPVSAEIATGTMWIFPLLVALMGFLACCCPGNCCPKCWICLFLLLIWIMVPFLLLIVGAVEWPMMMVVSDVCGSTETLAVKAIDGMSEKLCLDSMNGTFNTATRVCRMEAYEGNYININVTGIAHDILMANCNVTDSIDDVWAEVIELAQVEALAQYRTKFDEFKANSSYVLSAAVDNLADTTVDNILVNVTTLLTDMSVIASCQTMADLYLFAKDTVCCNLFGSIAAFFLAWYMIGLLFCCCGCCVGVLGYKRFPSRTWGNYVDAEEQVDEFSPDEMDMAAAEAVPPGYGDPYPAPMPMQPGMRMSVPQQILPPQEAYDYPQSPTKAYAPGRSQPRRQQPAVVDRQYQLPSYAAARSPAGGVVYR